VRRDSELIPRAGVARLLQPRHPHPISPSRGNISSDYPPGTLLRAREEEG
jgi:hypothetical protein